ncbi:OmpA family protein [Alkalihalobacillus sp. 1P02AB]|uniref:OmpA family protein n=1 Tax=Alkalihalobacillus sp. 1P02AB TaxID=3132260 RepID=UPI0039A5FB9D
MRINRRIEWYQIFLVLLLFFIIGVMSSDIVSANTEEQENISMVPLEQLRERYPSSEVYITRVPKSRVILTKVSLSQTEVDVLKTLNEFNAISIEEETTLTLPDNVLFDFDSDELLPGSDEVMDKLVQVIETSDGQVQVVGHTDNVGNSSYNQDLSERRAQAVVGALIERGINESNLIAIGKGDSEPIARNTRPDGLDDEEGRQKNRRVELIIEGL